MAALGRSQADLDGVVLALGQIQTKGKVSAEELMQMAERGLPVFQILEQKLGLTKKQLENIGAAGITSATGINALLTGLNEKFGGAMAKQAQTLAGQWSNLMDNVKSLVGNTGQAINDKIKGFIAKINEWFERNRADITETFDAIFTYAADILDTIVGILGTFADIFGSVMDAVTGYTQETGKNQASVWKGLFMFIANTIAAVGAVISIFIRGLAVGIGTLWNGIQMAAQAVVSTVMTVIAGAFSPVQYFLNKIIEGINIVRQVIGLSAIETIKFSQNMFGAAMDSMKQSAAENGKDIAELIGKSSEGMANDVKNAVSKIEANYDRFNSSVQTTGKSTVDINTRINKTLGDMSSSLNNVTGAHGGATAGAKKQGDAFKSLKDQAENALKPVLDRIKDTKKEIEETRKKINDAKDKWKEFRQEGVKALSDVRNEITKLKKEAADIEVKFKGQQDDKLSDRYVQILKDQKQAQADLSKEQSNTDSDPSRLLDLQNQITSLAKERQLIENGISKSVLESAIQYDSLSQSEKIILDIQKEKNREMEENRKRQDAAIEKQMILEAQANQKKIGDLSIHTGLKDGMMTASIELEKGKRTEIHDAENIALANDIAQKQAAFKTEYDTLTQQLASKYEAQKANLKQTQDLYKQFNLYLKEDTKKTAQEMIVYLQQVAENLRQVIALRAQAGMGSAGGGVSGARAHGGPVTAGEPYLVGERGPEIIIPNTNSYVVPNKDIGGGSQTIVNFNGPIQVRNDNDLRIVAKYVEDSITRSLQLGKLGIS